MSYSRESSTDLRSKVLHRDKGICKDCGVDCIALEHHRKHNKAIWLALIKYHDIPEHLWKSGDLSDGVNCWKCNETKRGNLENIPRRRSKKSTR